MADYERSERRERGDREERVAPPRRPRRDNAPARRRKGKGRSEYCPEGECFNYKEVDILERYVNEVGKIKPRRVTGNCARCQRELAREIKRARFLGLLPFIANTD